MEKKISEGLLLIGSLFAILLRWTVSLFPYSGQGKKPMHGDYEAQRHWMEITYNLPLNDWYVNSTRNNLLYWGLDYPPLTAYHSYVCGYIANWYNPKWVALDESRGFEGYDHKLFMRYTVLVADLLVYFPSVYLYWNWSSNVKVGKACAISATLLYPGLILIDHGHFQYNCVSLGLLVLAVAAIGKSHVVLGAILFVLSLNYKQMELYHALPFFCYLLGICVQEKLMKGSITLTKIGLAVIITFVLCWLPFIRNLEGFLHVVHRLFPFSRGLFEDKVANFWCALSVFVKIRSIFNISTLAKISLVTTLLSVMPSCINLIKKPTVFGFKCALINSSLLFFLFSYQVHEKSILLAAIPVCLIFTDYPLQCFWFLLISVFSIFPLLVKDKLVVPTFCIVTLYYFIVGRAYVANELRKLERQRHFILRAVYYGSLTGAAILSVASLTIPAPAKYPDLHSVLNVIYSCGHFLLFSLYFHSLQFNTQIPQFLKLKLQ